MGYYLLDNPNPNGPFYYTTRRGKVVAIVVHITAGLEDLDAKDDHSAENTARYAATTTRKVSWHSGSDTDSAFDLLPASYTAFQCVNYNSVTYGHEISKRVTDWRIVTPEWREATLRRAADHLAVKAKELGIPLRKATKAEVDHAIATGGAPVGFIGHHSLDPDRRTDPGLVNGVDTFPWDEFFSYMSVKPIDPVQEDDTMLHLFKGKDKPEWFYGDFGLNNRHVKTVKEAGEIIWVTVANGGKIGLGPNNGPEIMSQDVVDSITENIRIEKAETITINALKTELQRLTAEVRAWVAAGG